MTVFTFVCPTCGEERTNKKRRCYQCKPVRMSEETRQKIRQTLKGVKHSEERRKNISEAKRRHAAEGRVFDIAAYMHGKPGPRTRSAGAERIVKDGRVQVKCDDGKWRYRARVVWAAANGPIPRGRLIHHINEDPMDDRLENLQLVTRAEHARLHNSIEVAREYRHRPVEARKRVGSY
jgi:hypothetical protein